MSQVGSFGVNYKIIFADPSTSTNSVSLPVPIGTVGSLTEGDFVFVQADGAIDQYAFVKIEATGQAAMLTTTNAGSQNLMVGVAQVAAADNEYLWVWIGGPMAGGTVAAIKGKAAASYAAKANLNTTATAGVADDASTTLIKNVVGLETLTGAGTVNLFATEHLRVN
jgi:hypothetical protein